MIQVTTKGTNSKSSRPFPKLMKGNNNWIVWAINETTVFHISGGYSGVYVDNFQRLETFEDYNEPVTIQNV